MDDCLQKSNTREKTRLGYSKTDSDTDKLSIAVSWSTLRNRYDMEGAQHLLTNPIDTLYACVRVKSVE